MSDRDELILEHVEWARMRARTYVRRTGIPPDFREDIEQFACIGLIEAADRFDASRGAKFRTYAEHIVMGRIADGMRSGLCDFGRSELKRLKRGEVLRMERSAEADAFLERVPTREAWPDEKAMAAERNRILARSVAAMPRRLRLITVLYYYADRDQAEIAEIIGVTPGRISQELRQSRFWLLGRLPPTGGVI